MSQDVPRGAELMRIYDISGGGADTAGQKDNEPQKRSARTAGMPPAAVKKRRKKEETGRIRMNNRLDKYFSEYLDQFVFLELMPEYVKRERLDFMRNVPMPIKKEHLKELAGEEGIQFLYFIEGMVCLIGIDSDFRYRSQYVNFLKYVNKDIGKRLVALAIAQAESENLEHAAILLRAALCLNENDPDALYNYMLVCRNLYSEGEDGTYITDFKAEVLESLLKLKSVKPDFPMTYYFLGYAYVNAGKYEAAQRECKKFLSLRERGEEYTEITKRLSELEIPVKMEQGYMNVINGHWKEGLEILEAYKDEEIAQSWWPLSYYLGVGYSRTGRYDEALRSLKKALYEYPSGAEIMAELVIVYNALGDEVNAEKYKKKIEVVRRNAKREE